MSYRPLFISLMAGMGVWGYAQTLGPNPFLASPARTNAELVKQVQSNPVVLDRYCRHFQLSREAVIHMLQSLHKVALDQDTQMEMWYVPEKTGELKSRKMTIKKGSLVWADASGTPILKASCGNPLVRTDVAAQPAVSGSRSAASAEKPVIAPEKTIVEEMAEFKPSQPMLPAAPSAEFVEIPGPTGVVSEVRPSRFDIGSAFALLPSLLIGVGGNHNNSVPEPTSMAAIGGALALMAARKIKRRAR